MVDKDTKRTMVLGVEDHGLYRLVDIERKHEHALMAKSASDISALWHQRYGHFSLPYLSQLARENVVDGLLDIQQQLQGVCGPVRQVNNTEHRLMRVELGEQGESYNWFMQMSVDQ